MGRNSKYYGIRLDRRSQNFGFHMIARSQTIAEDRTWFYLLRSSAIVCDHDRRIADDRRSVFPYDRKRSQNFLRSAIRDRLRSNGNQPLRDTRVCKYHTRVQFRDFQFVSYQIFLFLFVEGNMFTAVVASLLSGMCNR